MASPTNINWDALAFPFDPTEVDFRLQSTFKKGNELQGIAIAYMDARAVQDRLDAVVGPANWSFDWTPLVTKGDVIIVAKGILTICGIGKSDVGDAGPTEPTKAAVSDCLKRAAVMWGIGRYLYSLGTSYCAVEDRGGKPVMAKGEVDALRRKLPPEYLPASDEQLQAITKLAKQLKRDMPELLTMKQASEIGKQWQLDAKAVQA